MIGPSFIIGLIQGYDRDSEYEGSLSTGIVFGVIYAITALISVLALPYIADILVSVMPSVSSAITMVSSIEGMFLYFIAPMIAFILSLAEVTLGYFLGNVALATEDMIDL